MSEYIITKRVECPTCGGKGHIEHPDGDIEQCTYCGRRGYFDIEATVDDVLRDCGAPAQPVSDLLVASALLAVAEQLAVTNKHLDTLADAAATYVANKI